MDFFFFKYLKQTILHDILFDILHMLPIISEVDQVGVD